jgi:hypothetical protein
VIGKPPTKWEVYEKSLRVPFYGIYDRYTNVFRLFQVAMRYQAVALVNQRFWFDELELGLGVWSGRYAGTAGEWLRWYDAAAEWVPTADERAAKATQQAAQESNRADEAQLKADRLAAKLRSMGIDPDAVD